MVRLHVKRDDMVTVIAGASKGKSGRVLSVDRDKGRVIVEGINVRKKTVRRSQEHPQGGIVEKECSIHASNVMLQEKYEARQKTKAADQGEPVQDEEPPDTPDTPDDRVDDEVDDDEQ